MLLKKIKLAGFKSFVDPTTLHFRGQLVGIVGPNGCGKSNIIDAVRWVMGESSAKTLRGESMTDVIFNGSSSRQPVGQASIDLVFDNSDGTIKGEYASYAEIAVRREVTRDGQSNYYLNNTKCRKRDVVDVFLGTGLGPRSYSIIEQGMISRIIEAKPEDLRSFFEEAAGISLYKKRRHETNLRMHHTRENLTRVADICREQEIQLEKLQKQSEAARRYQEYQAEKKTVEVELLSLRWRDYDEKLQTSSEQIRIFTTQLEEKLSLRVTAETKLEKTRQEHIDQADKFNAVQTRFYDLGSEIARREQTLQHHQERLQQMRADLADIKRNETNVQAELSKDQIALQNLQVEFTTLNPEYEQATKDLATAQATAKDEKTAMHTWQENWQALQEQAHKLQENAQIEKTRIEQLEKQTREYQARLDRLYKERDSLDVTTSEKILIALEAEYAALESHDKDLRHALEQVSNELLALRDLIKQEQRIAADLRGEIQILKGRKTSLEILQRAALGKSDTAATTWLQQQGLDNFSRVAELIQVESGWEKAVEIALGEYLEYICVEHDFEDLISNLPSALDQRLSLLQTKSGFERREAIQATELLAKITNHSELALGGLLTSIYIADDLTVALALRKTLAFNASIITKAGVWLGANWIRVPTDDTHVGILNREQELKTIVATLATLENNLQEIESHIGNKETLLSASQGKQTQLQQELKVHEQALRAKSNELSIAKTRQQNLLHRVAHIQSEITEYTEHMTILAEEISQSRAKLEITIESMSKFTTEKTELASAKEILQNTLTQAEQRMHEYRENAHKLEIAKSTLEAQKEALQQAINRLNKQLETINERGAMLSQTLAADDSPVEIVKLELNAMLEQKMFVEEDLHAARAILESLDQTITDLEKERQQHEKLAQNLREQLDALKMEWQSLKVRCETAEEGLLAMQVDIQQAIQQLSPNANELEWNASLEKLTKRIERLGPINLAAVDEYQTELERQTYLQAQHKDLTEALQTLEQAISKIDRETRSRFKETFDQVGQNFEKLFPKLFGGGQAHLELTENDLLEAGITVMAQPPGKKNSTIHLLSGGEKALTAVALVFSIFQLNPAPFCMLDEVDAPLDDANVGRYCSMLKEMSDSVQFIFITHNKIAMEIARQLAGVTMKEPGVSRLVSVDIDEAIEMAAA